MGGGNSKHLLNVSHPFWGDIDYKIIRKETVAVTTLDNYFNDIDDNVSVALMKIDVQGSELNILRGAEMRLLSKTNVIILEMSNHDSYKGAAKYYEIDEFLRNHGFTLFGNYSYNVNDKPARQTEWDSIYINSKLLD